MVDVHLWSYNSAMTIKIELSDEAKLRKHHFNTPKALIN